MRNFAKKAAHYLVLMLPPVLFLSYHPVISLGDGPNMNLELSIPEIWLVVFFLTTIPLIPELLQHFGTKKILVACILPLYFTITIIWSANKLRAVLTAGIFWLVVFAALQIINLLRTTKKQQLNRQIIYSVLISAIAVSIFCWVQCIMDLAGMSREQTLLCRGCVSASFGFPHPNGFAIEPQFMGNLLLAPTLLALYLFTSKKHQHFIRRALLLPIIILLATTLFITFSRGAIYAFIVAVIVQLILIRRHSIKLAWLKVIGIIAISFSVSLTMQGIFASLSPTNDTFMSGVAKSVHQLSLGKIDFRQPQDTNGTLDLTIPDDEAEDGSESHFSGYVAESTDIRLNLNNLAIRTWTSSAQYIFVGTGLGAAGIAMNAYLPSEIGAKEIVQNQYVSLLLETGIVGVLLIVFIAGYFVKCRAKLLIHPLFASTIIAFILSLFFFSGLPNALHIYLFSVIYACFAKNDSVIKEKV